MIYSNVAGIGWLWVVKLRGGDTNFGEETRISKNLKNACSEQENAIEDRNQNGNTLNSVYF